MLVAGLAFATLEWAVSPNALALVFACDVVAGWTFLIGCAVTSGALPPTRIPVLFLATGATWFIGPALGPWQDLYVGPLVVLLVAYPTGTFRGWMQRAVAIAGGAIAVLSGVAPVAPSVPLILLAAAAVGLLRGSRTPGPLRRGRRSAALAAVILGVAIAVSGEAASQGSITADEARILVSIAVAASALWLAADLRWGGWVNDALTRLVIELGDAEPSTIQDRLRLALDDDKLVLGYSLQGGTELVDEHGEVIVLPGPGADRQIVPLTSGGERIGVLVRGTGGDTDASLADGVAAAAALAIGNARLYAAVNGQVANISASRRRLVTAVETQRSRLQGDVADRIAPKLEDVARAIPESIGPDADRLRAAVEEIDSQLRALAAGIGPTDVAIHGLPQAIRSLANQCAIPVAVAVDAPGIDGDLAATAFFVAAEGLANASKHARASEAWVEVHRTGNEVVIEVRDDGIGGALAAPGSGLDGLDERVRARDGMLEIGTSREGGVRLTARLPVPRHARQAVFTDLARTA